MGVGVVTNLINKYQRWVSNTELLFIQYFQTFPLEIFVQSMVEMESASAVSWSWDALAAPQNEALFC